MKARAVSLRIPEVGFIAGTRVALGVGLGLLAADRFSRVRRRKTGWTLLAIGALTTVPIIAGVIRRSERLGTGAS